MIPYHKNIPECAMLQCTSTYNTQRFLYKVTLYLHPTSVFHLHTRGLTVSAAFLVKA